MTILPLSEARERLEVFLREDVEPALADGKSLLVRDLPALAADLRAVLALLAQAEKALERIAGHALSFPEPNHYAECFAPEPPAWALFEEFHMYGDHCGSCGSWCEIVRPGKTQCPVCMDGRDLGAIARTTLLNLKQARDPNGGGHG